MNISIYRRILCRGIEFMLFVSLLSGCGDKNDEQIPPLPPEDTIPQAPASVQKVNKFIRDGMKHYYFWADLMPEIDIRYELDSKIYFKKLLNDNDNWSAIRNDMEYQNTKSGYTVTTLGFSPVFFQTPEQIIGVIQYVYKDSPAEKAGLKRGNALLAVDGENITQENLSYIFNKRSLTLKYSDISINESGNPVLTDIREVHLIPKNITLNPINTYKVIDTLGLKIGYLVYTHFDDYHYEELGNVFRFFKSQNIRDLIMDFRYTGSFGNWKAAGVVGSWIAPEDFVSRNEEFICFKYNNLYKNELLENGKDNTIRLTDSLVSENLGIRRVFFLISKQTAEIGEAFILGLKPYMQVNLIGEKTKGMSLFMGTVVPQLKNDSIVPGLYEKGNIIAPELKNWAYNIIIGSYTNKNGDTIWEAGGLSPSGGMQINNPNNIRSLTRQLGELKEPLLSAAINIIHVIK